MRTMEVALLRFVDSKDAIRVYVGFDPCYGDHYAAAKHVSVIDGMMYDAYAGSYCTTWLELPGKVRSDKKLRIARSVSLKQIEEETGCVWDIVQKIQDKVGLQLVPLELSSTT